MLAAIRRASTGRPSRNPIAAMGSVLKGSAVATTMVSPSSLSGIRRLLARKLSCRCSASRGTWGKSLASASGTPRNSASSRASSTSGSRPSRVRTRSKRSPDCFWARWARCTASSSSALRSMRKAASASTNSSLRGSEAPTCAAADCWVIATPAMQLHLGKILRFPVYWNEVGKVPRWPRARGQVRAR